MQTFNAMLSRDELAAYQLRMLNAQLDYAMVNSRFYRERLSGLKLPLGDISALAELPFTTAQDIMDRGVEMLCVGNDQIERVVTVQSSGSSGLPKRLYFTQADLEYTVKLYCEGMRYLCRPGDEAFIFMPAASENSIGRLLEKGIRRMGAIPVVIGIPQDEALAVDALRKGNPYTMVGIPSQIRKLALLAPGLRPATVLLSADYISHAAKETITNQWGCRVFEHYGLTETAYGCAVECPALQGQHIRNDDLILEIVEVDGHAPVSPGAWGEIVVSTLRREGMPLIRYRTGDMGRLIDDPCACGDVLPRLDRVLGRITELRREPSIYEMDELLLRCDAILDYRASYANGGLAIELEAASPDGEEACLHILKEKWPTLPISITHMGISALRRNAKRGIQRG